LISNFKKIAIAGARGADAKKAEEILLLDLRANPQGLGDYILMMNANSQVHLRTLRDAVEDSLEKAGLAPLHQEGAKSGQWIALDYGGLLIHIFHREARKFYSLERLWPEAKKVLWQRKSRAPSPRAAKIAVKRGKRSR
jgi:ribosome-associated protein